jgi:hypothetical protein
MRKLLLLSLITALSFTACKQTVKKEKTNQQDVHIQAISIAEVMEMAEENIGKEVYFKGIVQHVCSHSGRRCILVDSIGELSLRVEAKGDIKGFNRELSGTRIAVKGTIQEKRLSAEFIDQWEEKTKAKDADIEEGGKHCASELANISSMRKWMKEHKKDHYSIYFINGTNYDILD